MYRTRTRTVEAFRLGYESQSPPWLIEATNAEYGAANSVSNAPDRDAVVVLGSLGRVTAHRGDWIVRHQNGNLEVVRHEDFIQKYEKA